MDTAKGKATQALDTAKGKATEAQQKAKEAPSRWESEDKDGGLCMLIIDILFT